MPNDRKPITKIGLERLASEALISEGKRSITDISARGTRIPAGADNLALWSITGILLAACSSGGGGGTGRIVGSSDENRPLANPEEGALSGVEQSPERQASSTDPEAVYIFNHNNGGDAGDGFGDGTGSTDTPKAVDKAERILGFSDPQGNPGSVPSALRGIFIKARPTDRDELENNGNDSVRLVYGENDDPTSWAELAANHAVAGDAAALALTGVTSQGFHYISLTNFANLAILTDGDANGLYEFEFHVWDGHTINAEAARLGIQIASVDDGDANFIGTDGGLTDGMINESDVGYAEDTDTGITFALTDPDGVGDPDGIILNRFVVSSTGANGVHDARFRVVVADANTNTFKVQAVRGAMIDFEDAATINGTLTLHISYPDVVSVGTAPDTTPTSLTATLTIIDQPEPGEFSNVTNGSIPEIDTPSAQVTDTGITFDFVLPGGIVDVNAFTLDSRFSVEHVSGDRYRVVLNANQILNFEDPNVGASLTLDIGYPSSPTVQATLEIRDVIEGAATRTFGAVTAGTLAEDNDGYDADTDTGITFSFTDTTEGAVVDISLFTITASDTDYSDHFAVVAGDTTGYKVVLKAGHALNYEDFPATTPPGEPAVLNLTIGYPEATSAVTTFSVTDVDDGTNRAAVIGPSGDGTASDLHVTAREPFDANPPSTVNGTLYIVDPDGNNSMIRIHVERHTDPDNDGSFSGRELIEVALTTDYRTEYGNIRFNNVTAGDGTAPYQIQWNYQLDGARDDVFPQGEPLDNPDRLVTSREGGGFERIRIRIIDADGGIRDQYLTAYIHGDDDHATFTGDTTTIVDQTVYTSTSADTYTVGGATVSGSLTYTDVDSADDGSDGPVGELEETGAIFRRVDAADTASTRDIDPLDFSSGTATVRGTYGTFTLTRADRDNAESTLDWSYAAHDGADEIPGGASRTDTIFLVTQGQFAAAINSRARITVNLTGVNDAPEVDEARSLLELNINEDSGGGVVSFRKIFFTDPDSTLFTYHVGVDLDGDGIEESEFTEVAEGSDRPTDDAYGRVGIGSFIDDEGDGVSSIGWRYLLDNTADDAIVGSDTVTRNFVIRITDNDATTPQSDEVEVTVNITGLDDGPTMSVSGTPDLDAHEDTDNTAMGAFTFNDIDSANNTVTFDLQLDGGGRQAVTIDTPISLKYGSITFTRTDGATATDPSTLNWEYTLDARAQALGTSGGTEVLQLRAQSPDGSFTRAREDFTITIAGADDASTLEVGASSTSISVSQVAGQVDLDTVTFTPTDPEGDYTSYTADDFLVYTGSTGDTVSDVFDVKSDGSGGFHLEINTTFLGGTAPTVAGSPYTVYVAVREGATGPISERSEITINVTSGVVATADLLDSSDVSTFNNKIAEGTDLSASGGWDVRDPDTAPADIVIEVTGITSDVTGLNDITTNTTLNNPTTNSGRTEVAGILGNFVFTNTLAGTGATDSGRLTWEYTANAEADKLADGSYTETLTLTIDGASHNIALTITGVNDDPVIASATAVTIAENVPGATHVASSAAVTFSASDPDTLPTGSAPTYSYSIVTDPTSLFEIDATQTLKLLDMMSLDYETHGASFDVVVEVSDGDGGTDRTTVTVTVEDGDDAPHTLAAQGTGSIEENDQGADTGITFTFTDDDTNNAFRNHQWDIGGHALANLFEIVDPDDDGTWTLKLSGTNQLDFEDSQITGNQILLDIFVYDDGGDSNTIEDVTIAVTGVNEMPAFTETDLTGTVNENDDSGPTIAGLDITLTDPDILTGINNTTHRLTVSDSRFEASVTGGAVTLMLNSGVELNYEDPNNTGTVTAETLALNGVLTLTITATDRGMPAREATTNNITIQIGNANDAPEIELSTSSTGSISEDFNFADFVQAETSTGIGFTFTDEDADDTAPTSWSVTGDDENRFGVVTVSEGVYELVTLSSDTLETPHRTMEIDFEDPNERTFTLSVTANDGDDDSNTITGITVNVTNAIDQMPTLSFRGGNSGASLTNEEAMDDQTFSTIILDPVDPDGEFVFTAGAFTVLDARFDVELIGGNFVLTYDYDMNNALTPADTTSVNILVNTPGGTSSQVTANIAVNAPLPQRPTFTEITNPAPDKAANEEDALNTMIAGGSFDFGDTDNANSELTFTTMVGSMIGNPITASASNQQINGAYGAFYFTRTATDASGGTTGTLAWEYRFITTRPDQLALGEHTDEIEVTISDSTTQARSQTIRVTIMGENDAPDLMDQGTGSVAENAGNTDTGITLTVTDADTVASSTTAVDIVADNFSTDDGRFVVVDDNGVFRLQTVAGAGIDYDMLTDDEKANGITFNVTYNDQSGAANATDMETVTITVVNDTSDDAVSYTIAADSNGFDRAITEGAAAISGMLTYSANNVVQSGVIWNRAVFVEVDGIRFTSLETDLSTATARGIEVDEDSGHADAFDAKIESNIAVLEYVGPESLFNDAATRQKIADMWNLDTDVNTFVRADAVSGADVIYPTNNATMNFVAPYGTLMIDGNGRYEFVVADDSLDSIDDGSGVVTDIGNLDTNTIGNSVFEADEQVTQRFTVIGKTTSGEYAIETLTFTITGQGIATPSAVYSISADADAEGFSRTATEGATTSGTLSYDLGSTPVTTETITWREGVYVEIGGIRFTALTHNFARPSGVQVSAQDDTPTAYLHNNNNAALNYGPSNMASRQDIADLWNDTSNNVHNVVNAIAVDPADGIFNPGNERVGFVAPYGTLNLMADGTYDFTPDVAALNALDTQGNTIITEIPGIDTNTIGNESFEAGEQVTQSFSILASTPSGDLVTQTLTFTITGIGTKVVGYGLAPSARPGIVNVIRTDERTDATGTLDFTVDGTVMNTGVTLAVVGSVTGSYGSLTFVDNMYTYSHRLSSLLDREIMGTAFDLNDDGKFGAGETLSESFTVRATDNTPEMNTADYIITFTIDGVNAPERMANERLSIVNQRKEEITQAHLKYTDVESGAADLTYDVTVLTKHSIEVRNSQGMVVRTITSTTVASDTANNTFTQDDINQGRVFYVHDGTVSFVGSFNFRVADGDANTSSGTFSFNTTTISASGDMDIDEDVTAPKTITGNISFVSGSFAADPSSTTWGTGTEGASFTYTGSYGTLEITNAGVYTYTLTADATTLNAEDTAGGDVVGGNNNMNFEDGEEIRDVFNITVSESLDGGEADIVLTITIDGKGMAVVTPVAYTVTADTLAHDVTEGAAAVTGTLTYNRNGAPESGAAWSHGDYVTIDGIRFTRLPDITPTDPEGIRITAHNVNPIDGIGPYFSGGYAVLGFRGQGGGMEDSEVTRDLLVELWNEHTIAMTHNVHAHALDTPAFPGNDLFISTARVGTPQEAEFTAPAGTLSIDANGRYSFSVAHDSLDALDEENGTVVTRVGPGGTLGNDEFEMGEQITKTFTVIGKTMSGEYAIETLTFTISGTGTAVATQPPARRQDDSSMDLPIRALVFADAPAGGVLTADHLPFEDMDSTDTELHYEISSLSLGRIEVRTGDTVNRTISTSGEFTQAELKAGRVFFVYTGTADNFGQFAYVVTDGDNSLPSANFVVYGSEIDTGTTPATIDEDDSDKMIEGNFTFEFLGLAPFETINWGWAEGQSSVEYRGTYGTLTVTATSTVGTVDYEYELTASEGDLNTASGGSFDDTEMLTDSIAITASGGSLDVDLLGTYNFEVTINGADEVVATPDGLEPSTTSTERTFFEAIAGAAVPDNTGVLTYTQGGSTPSSIAWTIDGTAGTAGQPVTHVGTYGMLTIAANGAYTYTPHSTTALDALDTSVVENMENTGAKHDGNSFFSANERFTESFDVTATGGGGSEMTTLDFTIRGATDPIPAAILNEGLAVINSGGVLAFTPEMFSAIDDVTISGSLIVSFTDLPSGTDGRLRTLSLTDPLTLTSEITVSAIGPGFGRLEYVHNATNTTNTTDTFTFRLRDLQGMITPLADAITFTITINQAPTITADGTLDVMTQIGSDTSSTGTLNIADLNTEDNLGNMTLAIMGTNGSAVAITPGDLTELTYGDITFTRNNTTGELSWVYALDEADTDTMGIMAGSTNIMEQITIVATDRGMISGHDSTDLITTSPLASRTYNLNIAVHGEPAAAMNAEPTETTNTLDSLRMSETGEIQLMDTHLEYEDTDNTASELKYTVTLTEAAPLHVIIDGIRFERISGDVTLVNVARTSSYEMYSMNGFIRNGNPVLGFSGNDTVLTRDDVISLWNSIGRVNGVTRASLVEGEDGSATFNATSGNHALTSSYTSPFWLDTTPTDATDGRGTQVTEFTQADINAGRVFVTFNGANLSLDEIDFSLELEDRTTADKNTVTIPDTGTVDITVNQAPVFGTMTLVSDDEVTEDSADTRVDGTLTFTDPNASQSDLVSTPLRLEQGGTELGGSVHTVAATYGYFELSAAGGTIVWTYHLAPDTTQYATQYAALQALNAMNEFGRMEGRVDSVTIDAFDLGLDGTAGNADDLRGSHDLVVTVLGADEPVAMPMSRIFNNELVHPTNVLSVADNTAEGNFDYEIDPDDGTDWADSTVDTWTRLNVSHGTLDIDADGNYTYTLTPGGIAGLAATQADSTWDPGDTTTDVINITANKTGYPAATATLTITIEAPAALNMAAAFGTIGGGVTSHENKHLDISNPQSGGSQFRFNDPDGAESAVVMVAELRIDANNNGMIEESEITTTTITPGNARNTNVAGEHGTFRFWRYDDEGTARVDWDYLAGGALHALALGSNETDVLTIKIRDAETLADSVDVASTNLTATIQGRNDRPTLMTSGTATIAEDQDAETDTGIDITVNDVDTGTTFMASATAPSMNDFTVSDDRFGVRGNMTDGFYLALLGNQASRLNATSEGSISLTITADDGAGITTASDGNQLSESLAQSVTVTVNPATTAAAASLSATGETMILEGEPLGVSGSLTFTDSMSMTVDSGVTWGTVTDADGNATYAGTYGSVTIEADGSYTYSITKANRAAMDTASDGSFDDDEELMDMVTINNASAGGEDADDFTLTFTIQGQTQQQVGEGDSAGIAADMIDGTDDDEIIQGGHKDDTITTGGGTDIVIGGYGEDTITLGAGAKTVIHRFSSIDQPQDAAPDADGLWRLDDGDDEITGFKRGVDKLILVDTDTTTPAGFQGFVNDSVGNDVAFAPQFDFVALTVIGFTIFFPGAHEEDGYTDGTDVLTGRRMEVSYSAELAAYNSNFSFTPLGEELFLDSDGQNVFSIQTQSFTSLETITAWFGGDEFFEIVGIDDLDIDIL